MSIFKRRTTKGETAFYHYRFRMNGKSYSGVCEGCTQKKQAEEFEKERKKLVQSAQSHKNVKSFLENFKEELTGGDSIAIGDAWEIFEQKPNNMGKRHKETVMGRWLDFVFFIVDNHGSISLNKISTNMAESYINHIRTKGKWGTIRINNLGKQFDVSIETLKSYMKASDFPENNRIQDIQAWLETKNENLTKEQLRKRKPYQGFSCQNLSTETKNNYLQTCKMVFNSLASDAGIIENPFAHIKKLPNKPVEREAFTPEELKLIADSSKGTWIYTLFITGVNTGLREGDICTLLWREVNLESGWIERTMRKTGKQVKIPILPALIKYLQSLTQNDKYCFPELAERYLGSKRTTIGHTASKFLAKLGIETNRKPADRSRHVSIKDIHSCRHTFAYIAAINGVPFPIVQSVVGHMSPEMTKKYIDHASEQEKRKAFDLIPDYMGILEDNALDSKLTADQKINEAISFLKSKKKLSDSDKHLLEILR